MINTVRSKLYNFWLSQGEVSTANQYRQFLEYIPENSRVLEIGIGTAMPLDKNAETIKRKNISITGIDIDVGYLKTANDIIEKNKLKNCKAFLCDFLKLEKNQYDYILFMESYPVISKELNSSFINHCKTYFSSCTIVYVHNLSDRFSIWRNLFKRNIKYMPWALIDFGRQTTVEQFKDFIFYHDYKIKEIKKVAHIRIPIWGHIKQYMYIITL